VQKLYDVSRAHEAGASSGLPQKEISMSREDDFDDIMDSPDEMDAGLDDTSEELIDDTLEPSISEPGGIEIDTYTIEIDEDETPESTPRPAPKRKAAKKKSAGKPKPEKRVAKSARKPAAKKVQAKKKKTAVKKKTAKKAVKKKAVKKKAGKKKSRR
jgi:hypothetical protein